MLLVCSGEDSYRSLEKTRELEAAFKTKYDPTGSAVDRLPSGKEGVEALLSALATSSLFAPRRFFRVDGLLSFCPKEKQKALIQSLERDVDATIVVTAEEGELAQKILKPFAELPKFHHYDHASLSPTLFLKWAMDYAVKRGITDRRSVQAFATATQGDTWTFVNEFQKWRAGGELVTTTGKEPTAYDVIDKLFQSSHDRWSILRRFDDANEVMAKIVNQTRSLVLVQSGLAQGVHPYVAQKLSRMKVADPSERYASLATAFAWSRTGQASAEESIEILG